MGPFHTNKRADERLNGFVGRFTTQTPSSWLSWQFVEDDPHRQQHEFDTQIFGARMQFTLEPPAVICRRAATTGLVILDHIILWPCANANAARERRDCGPVPTKTLHVQT